MKKVCVCLRECVWCVCVYACMCVSVQHNVREMNQVLLDLLGYSYKSTCFTSTMV